MQIVIGIGTNIGYGGTGVTGPRLQVYVQPAGAVLNTPFTTQPVIRALNADGTVATSFTGSITLTKISGPGSLNGVQSKNAVAGVATYTDLEVDADGTYILQAATTLSSIYAPANTVPFTCSSPSSGSYLLLNQGGNLLLNQGGALLLNA